VSILSKTLTFAAIGIGGTLVVAVGLVFSQSPRIPAGTDGLDFSGTLNRTTDAPQELEAYQARDGSSLGLRSYQSGVASAPLMVLVHGSGWHGLQFDALAKAISAGGHADVLVPDLRGHGPNPARRGDIDYIGQFEDDLADLINARRKDGQAVVLGGHSSGGGLVVRFAGGEHGGLINKAILMAPFLKYDAPTMRPNSGGWAHTAIRRLIGLSILNTFQITALNHLPVIAFSFPNVVLESPLGHTATQSYSHRLNTSYAPRNDYLKDVAALPEFLLLVGTKDEAFQADQFEPVLSAVNSNGTYQLIKDIGHLDLVDAPETLGALIEFLKP